MNGLGELSLDRSKQQKGIDMKRDDVVRDYGIGPVPRILDAINCFRRQYGKWPTRLNLDEGMIGPIKEYHLTPLGWAELESRLEIRPIVDGRVVAEDDQGNRYEYDAELIRPQDKADSADCWIWGCRVWPDDK